ncbi:MAG: S8 family serine peptidase [Planctomycetes bacterium]|nr:S8 family serine peptidase [Planctomycetota bacterium]
MSSCAIASQIRQGTWTRCFAFMPVLAVTGLLILPSRAESQIQESPFGDTGESLDKIDAQILWHRQMKVRPPTMSVEQHEEYLRQLGIFEDNLDFETSALYVHERLSEEEIAALAAQGIEVDPDIWVPPVADLHPLGFHVARVNYGSLQLVQDDDRVVRLMSIEQRYDPQNDLSRIMIDRNMETFLDGSGVKVAVADTGLDTSHADIPTPAVAYNVTNGSSNIAPYNAHGTHVTGTVLGSGAQSGGSPTPHYDQEGEYGGMAPGADLYFYKIVDSSGNTTSQHLIDAFSHAAQDGCQVFNLSFGGDSKYRDGSDSVEQALDSAVVNDGIVVFVSAGNDANKARHGSGMAAPGNNYVDIDFTIDNSSGSAAAVNAFRVLWRDNNSSDGNISVQCTNCDRNESSIGSCAGGNDDCFEHWFGGAGQQSSRGTEYHTYGLFHNVPSGQSRTYTLRATNSAGSGTTPLVHLYRVSGDGTFDNADPNYTITSPGLADKAIAVGAWAQRRQWVNSQGNCSDPGALSFTIDGLAPFSSRGPRIDGMTKPECVAPGAATISVRDTTGHANNANRTISNDYYVSWGTSMASPVAAGAAAALLEAEPNLTPTQVRSALLNNASIYPSSNDLVGYGLINIRATVNRNTRSIIHVDANVTGGANDGSSWSNAYGDLQDGLAGAAAGDEVWVADGEYKPHSGTDQNASFELKDWVEIYGGFAGGPNGESYRHQRDPTTNQSILTGDLLGNDGTNFSNRSDNSMHVVTGFSVGRQAVLDGFTIRGGYANSHVGAGMFIDAGSPTIVDCLIEDNWATSSGGGVYAGGSNAHFLRCTFIGNKSDFRGGGMYIVDSSAQVTNGVFSGNQSVNGGGLTLNRLALPFGGSTITNCSFSENTASSNGGGIYNEGGDSEVINCILWNNQDQNGTTNSAAQIYVAGGSPTVTYSCVMDASEDGSAYSGVGNIDYDPKFLDAVGGDAQAGTEDDDLRLSFNSPCIDIANNEAVPSLVGYDREGDRRFEDDPNVTDGGSCALPQVDMGAYEGGHTDAEAESVDNGGFDGEPGELGPPGWTVTSSSKSAPEPEWNVINILSMENALNISRPDADSDSSLVVDQVLAVQASSAEALTLSFDVLIYTHNFAEYNLWNVYPANVWVDYQDDQGQLYTIRRSFYTDVDPSHEPDPLPLAEQIPAGIWQHRTFDLLQADPFMDLILQITVGAEGWSYNVAFDNVSLLVTLPDSDCGDCPTDSDGSGNTGAFDLAILLGAWGPVTPDSACLDADENGFIGAFDLAVLLGSWGLCQ